MKNLFLAVSLGFCSLFTLSQGEGSVFTAAGRGVSTTFVTDYQALGINPANLAWSKEFRGKTLAIGLGETGFSFSSPIINSPVLKGDAGPLDFQFDRNSTYQEFQEFSRDLQQGFQFNFDSRLFGIALTTKIGGFAFAVTERYSMNAGLSEDFADLATFGFGAPYFDSLQYDQGGNTFTVANSPSTFDSLQNDTSVTIQAGLSNNPKTIPELLEGTRVQVSWIREFNFGFGTQILKNEKWGIYAGVGVKYLQGMALLDVTASNGTFNGFSSYSPSFNSANRGGLLTAGTFRASLPKAAGSGFGVDLGVNIKAFKKLKIGIAVNDIGSITWREQTSEFEADTALKDFRVRGFYKDANSIEGTSGPATFDSILNNLVEVRTGNFERRVFLPATLRIGASIQLGRFFEFGGEIISPLNEKPGNFTKSIYSLGGDIKLGPLVLQSGIVMQNNQILRVPAGFVLSPAKGAYEFGISTRDLRSLIQFSGSENPMISAAFGFLRFRI